MRYCCIAEKLLPDPYRTAWLRFLTHPPPGELTKEIKINLNARDRSVSKKSEYQEVNMSEANRMFVESVIKRCQSERGAVSTQRLSGGGSGSGSGSAAGGGGSSGGGGGSKSEEMMTLVAMKWPSLFIDKAFSAIGWNSGVPELLDWLCLNTPESELPVGFAAQMRPKVEVFSFKKEAEKAAKAAQEARLFKIQGGEPEPEPEPDIDSAVDANGFDATLAEWVSTPAGDARMTAPSASAVAEECATARRFSAACKGKGKGKAAEVSLKVEDIEGEGEEEDWETSTEEELAEEFETLQSIYGEDDCVMCKGVEGKTTGVIVRLETPTLGKVVLQCWVCEDIPYPKEAPVCVMRGAGMTSALCVSVTVKLQSKAASMVGDPMLYSLVEELRDDDSWLLMQDSLEEEPAAAGNAADDVISASVSDAVSEVSDQTDGNDISQLSDFVDAFEVDPGTGTGADASPGGGGGGEASGAVCFSSRAAYAEVQPRRARSA